MPRKAREKSELCIYHVILRGINKLVRWYNQKYQRTGHLFQDRYKSEPVNDMRYFQTVFRYIHWNPLRAGLETVLGTYLWTSYNEYAALEDSFIDIDKVLDLFSDYDECMDYLHTDSEEMCMEYASHRLSDLEALDRYFDSSARPAYGDIQDGDKRCC